MNWNLIYLSVVLFLIFYKLPFLLSILFTDMFNIAVWKIVFSCYFSMLYVNNVNYGDNVLENITKLGSGFISNGI